MKGDPEREGSLSPNGAELIGRLRAEIGRWKPRRGPDYQDLMVRVGGGLNRWTFYPVMSAVLVAILIVAFLVMTTLHIGSLGGQSVHAQLGR